VVSSGRSRDRLNQVRKPSPSLQARAKEFFLVITQCSMRHLYAASSEPGVSYLIDKAKTYERRRCNHLPEDYPEPLSTKDCLASVVDPKDTKTNKHRYVVASQEMEVRKHMRSIMGVPLVYINRSVMIMEPMAGATAENRDREEKQKFRDGLKGGRGSGSLKRKREEDNEAGKGDGEEVALKKSRRQKGPKGPNPLSVKKPKKRQENEAVKAAPKGTEKEAEKESGAAATASAGAEDGSDPSKKRKRRRKHKSGADGAAKAQEVADGDDGEE
jgi:U3 small nucleolar RNA-associated protein 23